MLWKDHIWGVSTLTHFGPVQTFLTPAAGADQRLEPLKLKPQVCVQAKELPARCANTRAQGQWWIKKERTRQGFLIGDTEAWWQEVLSGLNELFWHKHQSGRTGKTDGFPCFFSLCPRTQTKPRCPPWGRTRRPGPLATVRCDHLGRRRLKQKKTLRSTRVPRSRRIPRPLDIFRYVGESRTDKGRAKEALPCPWDPMEISPCLK